MTINDEAWVELKEKIKSRFSEVEENILAEEMEDDLGHKYQTKTETLIFQSELGTLKIERQTRPKILDKKAHYHKGAGGAKIEYVFSEDEKTSKVDILKKDEVTGEWVPVELPGDRLAF